MDVEQVINDNKGLMWAQIKRLHLSNEPDAESIGYEALYNAAMTFDSTKGIKFSTYATCCIYNALGCYIRTINRKRQIKTVSYNNLTGENEFLTLLTSDEDVELDLLNKELYQALHTAVDDILSNMPLGKQHSIVKLWKDSGFKLSYNSIAKQLKVSQPYVSQTLSAFLFKLRKRLEKLYYA